MGKVKKLTPPARVSKPMFVAEDPPEQPVYEQRTIELLPKQLEFVQCQSREVLYSGAFGAGKSRALCWKMVMRACHPGALEILTRKHNVTLKRTTLKTLLEPDGMLPPVLPPGTYIHHKSAQLIQIIGGGSIVYFGMDDPMKIGSQPATGAGVDEAVELDEEDWTALRGRTRVRLSGLPNQLYGACNPGAPTHHLAKRFGLVVGSHPEPNCEAITTCSADNWFLPEDYIADLNTFKGVALQRYVKGLWVAAEGLVFPAVLECFTPHTKPPTGVYVAGIDFGFRNPFCALSGVIYKAATGKDIIYIYAERYQANTPIEQHALSLGPPNGPGPEGCIWFCDPEDPEAIRELKKYDLNCKRAVNNITYGIDSVNGLAENGQLFISDRCIHTREEAEVYCYSDKNLKEKPIDQFNHAMSALRYIVASARRRNLIEWTRKGTN